MIRETELLAVGSPPSYASHRTTLSPSDTVRGLVRLDGTGATGGGGRLHCAHERTGTS